MSRIHVSGALALALLLPLARAGSAGPVVPQQSPKPYAWQGHWQERDIHLVSKATGATLHGVLRKPTTGRGPWPGVVIVPGSGGANEKTVAWAARMLAGHGYMALSVDPQGEGGSQTFGNPRCAPSAMWPCPGVPFQSMSNFTDAFESGIDYFVSAADPWRSSLDASHIGLAGHSEAAGGLSYVQQVDHRVDAVVAWDNLASNLAGDDGEPGGKDGPIFRGVPPTPSTPITPRVPALGEASDYGPTYDPQADGPEVKKTAYEVWRKHHVPVVMLVFAGQSHFAWAQTASAPAEDKLRAFAQTTMLWFDRWLKGDRSALKALLAPRLLGVARTDLLSSKYTSAAYVDGRDCQDLRRC